MKRKRKIFYTVMPLGNWWWTNGLRKWLSYTDAKGHRCSTHRNCRTFDQAMRAAIAVPTGEVVVTRWAWNSGRTTIRNYYYRRSQSCN